MGWGDWRDPFSTKQNAVRLHLRWRLFEPGAGGAKLVAALLLSRRSGKLPTKRMMERLRFWMMGWATDEELAAALGPAKKRN